MFDGKSQAIRHGADAGAEGAAPAEAAAAARCRAMLQSETQKNPAEAGSLYSRSWLRG